MEVKGAVATTRGRWARRRDNKLESGKSGNVVFFARFDLVILAIRNSLGSCGSSDNLAQSRCI
jgi:hypothetical protein